MLLKLFNRSEDGTLIEKVCKDIMELNEAFTAGWATAPHLIKKVEQTIEDAVGKKDKKAVDEKKG